MRTPLVRAAAPLRFSYLRSPINHIHRPHIQQALQSSLSQFSQSTQPFSTYLPLHTINPSPSKPPPAPNPSFGGASLKELGTTRTVKIVVYIAAGIIGTVETFTWSKFLWAKFGPKNEDVEIEK